MKCAESLSQVQASFCQDATNTLLGWDVLYSQEQARWTPEEQVVSSSALAPRDRYDQVVALMGTWDGKAAPLPQGCCPTGFSSPRYAVADLPVIQILEISHKRTEGLHTKLKESRGKRLWFGPWLGYSFPHQHSGLSPVLARNRETETKRSKVKEQSLKRRGSTRTRKD